MNPLINGVSYSWSSINVLIAGIPAIGIEAISYGEEQEIEDIYGKGNNPTARAFGNITREGSITLHLNEVNALVLASPTGRIQDIPEFDIIIAFLPENGTVIKHRMVNCRFTNNSIDMSQNDTHSQTELTLAVGDIDWAA